MFTIRTTQNIDEMIAYLRNHKVKFSSKLKPLIEAELQKMCNVSKRKRLNLKHHFNYENKTEIQI